MDPALQRLVENGHLYRDRSPGKHAETGPTDLGNVPPGKHRRPRMIIECFEILSMPERDSRFRRGQQTYWERRGFIKNGPLVEPFKTPEIVQAPRRYSVSQNTQNSMRVQTSSKHGCGCDIERSGGCGCDLDSTSPSDRTGCGCDLDSTSGLELEAAAAATSTAPPDRTGGGCGCDLEFPAPVGHHRPIGRNIPCTTTFP
jgi:hypothetical protein